MSRKLALAILIVASLAGGTRAQSLWLPLSVIGYGGLGTAAGVGICHDCDWDTAGFVVIGGSLVGLVAGFFIGDAAAEDALDDSRIRERNIWGARVGSVAGFATGGALVAAAKIDGDDDNADGEDEEVFRNYSLIGTALGVLFEIFYERSFDPRLQISAIVGPDATGSAFVGLGFRHSW